MNYTIQQKRDWLESHGFYVGERSHFDKPDSKGMYVVMDGHPKDLPVLGQFYMVANDLDHLITSAFYIYYVK